MNELINYEGVYRTAQATPGLLFMNSLEPRSPGSLQKLYYRGVAALKCIAKYLPDQNLALSSLYSETY